MVGNSTLMRRDSLQYEKAMSDEKIKAKLTAAVSGAG
jgi:hypothetical protein